VSFEDVEVPVADFAGAISICRSTCSATAYQVFSEGLWGYADDLLDLAKLRDPRGDADWRVQMTRRWLREYERQWPF
jgi:hypothetical protein